MTILWYVLFILIIGLIIVRLTTLQTLCPSCKARKLNNFEDSKLIESNEKTEIYEISQSCINCNYQIIWYLKRTFDIHGTPKDKYLNERPDIQTERNHE